MKKMMGYPISFSAIWILLLVQGLSAAEVQLKRFKAGDVIYAEDVNGNFQVLADTVKQLQQEIAELKQRNAALAAEIKALKQQPTSTAAKISKIPALRLRSQGEMIAEGHAQQVFHLNLSWRPRLYIENDFDANVDVVIDHVTGLTWQRSGSPKALTYQEAQQYIAQLNQERFAGHTDWRLPTVDELLSLLKSETQSHGFYLNPIFNNPQEWYWSADKSATEAVWYAHFGNGNVYYRPSSSIGYTRAVRTGQ